MPKDRPRGSGLAAALLALSVAALVAAEEAAPANRSMPEDWVTGTTLTDRDLDFAIDAPDLNWRWSILPDSDSNEPPGSTLWCKREGRSYWFYVVVYSNCGGEVNDEFVEDLHHAIQKDAAGSGKTLSRFDSAPSSAPLPGSRRVSWTLSGADGTTYIRGYLVGSKRIYLLECACAEARDPDEFKRFASSFRALVPPPAPAGHRNLIGGPWSIYGALVALFVVWRLDRQRPIAILCIVWFLIVIVLSVVQAWSALWPPRLDQEYAHQLGYVGGGAFMTSGVAVFGIVLAISRLAAERAALLASNAAHAVDGPEAPIVRRLEVDGAPAVINPTWAAVRIALSQIGRPEPSHVTLSNAADEQVQAAGVPSRLFLVFRQRTGGEWTWWSLGREESAPCPDPAKAPLTLQDAIVVFQEFYERDRIPPGYELRAAADESAG